MRMQTISVAEAQTVLDQQQRIEIASYAGDRFGKKLVKVGNQFIIERWTMGFQEVVHKGDLLDVAIKAYNEMNAE